MAKLCQLPPFSYFEADGERFMVSAVQPDPTSVLSSSVNRPGQSQAESFPNDKEVEVIAVGSPSVKKNDALR